MLYLCLPFLKIIKVSNVSIAEKMPGGNLFLRWTVENHNIKRKSFNISQRLGIKAKYDNHFFCIISSDHRLLQEWIKCRLLRGSRGFEPSQRRAGTRFSPNLCIPPRCAKTGTKPRRVESELWKLVHESHVTICRYKYNKKRSRRDDSGILKWFCEVQDRDKNLALNFDLNNMKFKSTAQGETIRSFDWVNH